MDANVLNVGMIGGVALACLEALTIEQAEKLHRTCGVELIMNDGRLTEINGNGIRCGMDCGAAGVDWTVPLLTALIKVRKED